MTSPSFFTSGSPHALMTTDFEDFLHRARNWVGRSELFQTGVVWAGSVAGLADWLSFHATFPLDNRPVPAVTVPSWQQSESADDLSQTYRTDKAAESSIPISASGSFGSGQGFYPRPNLAQQPDEARFLVDDGAVNNALFQSRVKALLVSGAMSGQEC